MKIDLLKGIKASQWATLGIVTAIIIFIAYKIIMLFTFSNMNSDIPSHCQFALNADINWRLYPANFGLYLAVNGIRHILPDLAWLHGQLYAMVIILCLSLGFKWLLSTLIIRQMLLVKGLNFPFWVPVILGTILFFLFAIPYRYLGGEPFYYLGSFVPTVWHNSTIIASIPFSILLFWLSSKELDNPSPQRVIWISLLAFIIICIKPSYIFVYSVGFPLLFFFRYGLKVRYWVHYVPVALSGLFILLQWWLLFKLNTSSWDKSSIDFTPFKYWNSISTVSKLPLALSASVLAPILALFVIDTKKHITKVYATIVFAASAALYLMVCEDGDRFSSANFYWQIVPATYLLFLVSLPSLISGYLNFSIASSTKKFFIVITSLLFLGHLMAGVYYIKYIFDNYNYL